MDTLTCWAPLPWLVSLDTSSNLHSRAPHHWAARASGVGFQVLAMPCSAHLAEKPLALPLYLGASSQEMPAASTAKDSKQFKKMPNSCPSWSAACGPTL